MQYTYIRSEIAFYWQDSVPFLCIYVLQSTFYRKVKTQKGCHYNLCQMPQLPNYLITYLYSNYLIFMIPYCNNHKYKYNLCNTIREKEVTKINQSAIPVLHDFMKIS